MISDPNYRSYYELVTLALATIKAITMFLLIIFTFILWLCFFIIIGYGSIPNLWTIVGISVLSFILSLFSLQLESFFKLATFVGSYCSLLNAQQPYDVLSTVLIPKSRCAEQERYAAAEICVAHHLSIRSGGLFPCHSNAPARSAAGAPPYR